MEKGENTFTKNYHFLSIDVVTVKVIKIYEKEYKKERKENKF